MTTAATTIAPPEHRPAPSGLLLAILPIVALGGVTAVVLALRQERAPAEVL